MPYAGPTLALLAAIATASPTFAARAPTAIFDHFTYRQTAARAADGPPPPGMYHNPVIPGSYPDPSIVRVGRDYYLATSSFTAWPAIPIFHSRDLVRWTQIGHAVTRPEQMVLKNLDASWQGLYAPDLKYHRGRFYLLSTCYACGGNFVMTATSAAGPWSNPRWLPFEGIDPSIFFDDDGRAYVLNNGPPLGEPRYDGHRAIWLQEIDLASLRMIGPRTTIVDGGVDLGAPPFWVEGPHLIKRDGRYVLIAAQGGTKERHAQVVFASQALRGPYLPGPANPILTQAGLDPHRSDPVSSAGHADLVETPEGEWWAVFLANRPYGPHDLLTNIGREVFLLPVDWRDGWPAILPSGRPVPLQAERPKLPLRRPGSTHTAIDEAFATPRLRFDWVSLGTPQTSWWRVADGKLHVDTRAVALGDKGQPAFLAVRQRHHDAVATTRVTFNPVRVEERAGLVAYADAEHFLALSVARRRDGRREVRLERRSTPKERATGSLVAAAALTGGGSRPVELRITMRGGVYRFAFSEHRGRWRNIGGDQDATILSIKATDGFVGTLIGLYGYSPRGLNS